MSRTRGEGTSAILVVEDDPVIGKAVQKGIMEAGHECTWTKDGQEGLQQAMSQKFDVVVVNFLNKKNAADQRVYQLLDQKFRLFNGVFGASDEVLGTIESGVDFEKRIVSIYQKCRTPQQIEFEFDQLQEELGTEIVEGQRTARELLLDNFDQEVVEKVRIQSQDVLDQFNGRLWRLTGLAAVATPVRRSW